MQDGNARYTTPTIRTIESDEIIERLGPQAGGSSGFNAFGDRPGVKDRPISGL